MSTTIRAITVYSLIAIFTGLILFNWFSDDNLKKDIIEGMETTNDDDVEETDSDADDTTNIDNTDVEASNSGEYKEYDSSDAMILSQQNAGNIAFLKSRIDELSKIGDSAGEMQQNIELLQSQINDLVQQQADYAQQISGGEPVDVTGTDLAESPEGDY